MITRLRDIMNLLEHAVYSDDIINDYDYLLYIVEY